MIVVSLSSVSLLVFSAGVTPAEPLVTPMKCKSGRCCSQLNESKSFTPWDMVSQIMLRSAA
jgi:hypothetical protein